MTIDQLERLKAMVEPGQTTWDLSPNDQAAIRALLNAFMVLGDRVLATAEVPCAKTWAGPKHCPKKDPCSFCRARATVAKIEALATITPEDA